MNPKLRPVDAQWIEHEGHPALLLQDRSAIGSRVVLVPQALAPLLALCDGTRDVAALGADLEQMAAIRLSASAIEQAISQLDRALLLDNERFSQACRQALEAYRSAPHRPAFLAGLSYPADPQELREMLEGHIAGVDGHAEPDPLRAGSLRGLICPHIDYDRGGPVYATIWGKVREALDEADLFIILGTDHTGRPGEITLTRQSYQTPFGLLPTDLEVVNGVAKAMGEEAAFRSELNHLGEHSVEMAAVWLHHAVGDRPIRVVPVLCGSFHPFIEGKGSPEDYPAWKAGAEALGEVAGRDGVMVIAAADLSHIGPAFGDPSPLGDAEKDDLAEFDSDILAAVVSGDAQAFLRRLVQETDRHRVCGLPPIYLAMRLLGEVRGELVSYSQCPAPNGSTVSVAGLYWARP